MSQQKLLKDVIQTLGRAGVQYMMTGSLVSSFQGEPRSTHDIDIVIAISKSDTKKLIKAFPIPDYYLDEDSINEAIDNDGMFNLIDVTAGEKVDFWLLTEEAFDHSRFKRRIVESFLDMSLFISTPEDTILAKLRWAKLSGGSEKQFIDALRVYEVQYGILDMEYLWYWAKLLGVESLLERLTKEAEIID